MSRFDLETDRRAIEVALARPARFALLDLEGAFVHKGLYVVRCGHCGANLTTFDAPRRLIFMERWTLQGWTLLPHGGRHRSRNPHHSREVLPWEVEGPSVLATGTRERGDYRVYARFPVLEENRWRRLELPILMTCYRCREKSGVANFPDPDL